MTTADLDLVAELARAIHDGRLELHYQPEIDLASGAVVGMEALLRWAHPRRGLLWPRDFLPVAEAGGLTRSLGRWVLEQCIREAAAWSALPSHPALPPRQLWLNIAADHFCAPDFLDEMAGLLDGAGLAPGTLGIEITEQTVTRGEQEVAGRLARLRELGVALALDDFGTWYSSLASLGELRVDAVKLDRRFVRGVGSDLDDDSIVDSVIRLAHANDLYVVAEGVESWSEGARLLELGCDRAHGYLFSGPQRAERARWMLVRGVGWRSAAPAVADRWDPVPGPRGSAEGDSGG